MIPTAKPKPEADGSAKQSFPPAALITKRSPPGVARELRKREEKMKQNNRSARGSVDTHATDRSPSRGSRGSAGTANTNARGSAYSAASRGRSSDANRAMSSRSGSGSPTHSKKSLAKAMAVQRLMTTQRAWVTPVPDWSVRSPLSPEARGSRMNEVIQTKSNERMVSPSSKLKRDLIEIEARSTEFKSAKARFDTKKPKQTGEYHNAEVNKEIVGNSRSQQIEHDTHGASSSDAPPDAGADSERQEREDVDMQEQEDDHEKLNSSLEHSATIEVNVMNENLMDKRPSTPFLGPQSKPSSKKSTERTEEEEDEVRAQSPFPTQALLAATPHASRENQVRLFEALFLCIILLDLILQLSWTSLSDTISNYWDIAISCAYVLELFFRWTYILKSLEARLSRLTICDSLLLIVCLLATLPTDLPDGTKHLLRGIRLLRFIRATRDGMPLVWDGLICPLKPRRDKIFAAVYVLILTPIIFGVITSRAFYIPGNSQPAFYRPSFSEEENDLRGYFESIDVTIVTIVQLLVGEDIRKIALLALRCHVLYALYLAFVCIVELMTVCILIISFLPLRTLMRQFINCDDDTNLLRCLPCCFSENSNIKDKNPERNFFEFHPYKSPTTLETNKVCQIHIKCLWAYLCGRMGISESVDIALPSSFAEEERMISDVEGHPVVTESIKYLGITVEMLLGLIRGMKGPERSTSNTLTFDEFKIVCEGAKSNPLLAYYISNLETIRRKVEKVEDNTRDRKYRGYSQIF